MERITSRANPLAAHLRKLGQSRGYRAKAGEYLGDGGKLLGEALAWGAELTAAVCTPGFPLPELPAGLPLLGAALREDTVDARRADLSRCVLLIGSEGRGLSPAALAACGQTVRIPMSPRCESLNAAVAAAVLLWEGWRQE